MMKQLAAIALLTVRDAVRSRLLAALIAALLLIVIGLPLLVKGDGTAPGRIVVMLHYTLGAVFFVLSVASLWMGAAAVSRDIEGRHLRLTRVKPVHAPQVWLGRWCGILLLNTLFLLVCGVTTAAVVAWTTRSTAVGAADHRILSEQRLVARRRISPERPALEDEVAHRFRVLQHRNDLPANLSRNEALQAIREHVLTQRSVVPPGQERAWTFQLPGAIRPGTPVALRFTCFPLQRSPQPVRGAWTLHPGARPDAVFTDEGTYPPGQHLIELPASILQADSALHAQFHNSPAGESTTVTFPSDQAVELLVREGSFAMNLVRVHLVFLCRLALIAALGLTIGCLFSSPVAVFVSVALLVSVLISHTFTAVAPGSPGAGHHHGPPTPPSTAIVWLQDAGTALIETVRGATAPLYREDILASLADGILVSWTLVGHSVLILVGVYAGTLCLAGSAALHHRELAG